MAQTIPISLLAKQVSNKLIPELTKQINSAHLTFGAPVFIRIFKQEAELELWLKDKNNFKLFKTYKICNYGFAGLGPKLAEGDGK
ncbi:MAG TPA: 2-dehydro-3-deoxyphosphooctonate aldolase, partial [Oceanospirillales bacterium]|nr:2-dehydro-3-deoxyphosphooctonate aldolase [Oceanospirillales bacterium]